jgi:hypothetical protein
VLGARLPDTPPFDGDFFLLCQDARALPGVEQVDGDRYRRIVVGSDSCVTRREKLLRIAAR